MTPTDDGISPLWPGTRLQVAFARLGEVEQPIGFFDDELDMLCSFVTTEAGLACAPKQIETPIFADPECTKPVFVERLSPCAGSPTLTTGSLVSMLLRDCGEPVYRPLVVGGAYQGPVFEPDSSGSCVARSRDDDETILEADRLAEETLVGATSGAAQFGDLMVRSAHADDGARQVLGFEGADGEACTVAPYESSTTRACVPRHRIPGLFASTAFAVSTTMTLASGADRDSPGMRR